MRFDLSWLGRRPFAKPTPRALGHSGTPLGETRDGTVVSWPTPSLEQASHGLMLGASGTGKSVLAASTVAAEADRLGEEIAHFVVDPKGDLLPYLVGATKGRRIIHLSPFHPEGQFAFNLKHLFLGSTPLTVRALQIAQLVSLLSSGLSGRRDLSMGARQIDVLQRVIGAALSVDDDDASILLANEALASKEDLSALCDLAAPEFAEPLRGLRTSPDLLESCAARLRLAFETTPSLARMIGARSSVQFGDLFAPGTLTLVSLGNPPGGLTSLRQFWASLFVRLALDWLMSRPSPCTDHHVRVVIDEAHLVAPVLDGLVEDVLTTGRSRGVSLTVMAQTLETLNVSKTLLPVLFSNSQVRLFGRLSPADAETVSRFVSTTPGIDESIGEVRKRFAGRLSNLPNGEFFSLERKQRLHFRAELQPVEDWLRAPLPSSLSHSLEEPARLSALVAASTDQNEPDDAEQPADNSNKPFRSPWG